MLCPLCGGPVDRGDAAFGRETGDAKTTTPADLQLSEALWMAIQALDNEADVLRTLGGDEGADYADQAERQARQLRTFAREHADRAGGDGHDGRG